MDTITIKTLSNGDQYAETLYGYIPIDIYSYITNNFDPTRIDMTILRDYADGDGLHVFTALEILASLLDKGRQLERNGCPLDCFPSSCLGLDFKVLYSRVFRIFILSPEVISNTQYRFIYKDITPEGKEVEREFKNWQVPLIRKQLDYLGVYL